MKRKIAKFQGIRKILAFHQHISECHPNIHKNVARERERESSIDNMKGERGRKDAEKEEIE